MLDRVLERLQREQIVRLQVEAVKRDSTIVQVHPDGAGLRSGCVVFHHCPAALFTSFIRQLHPGCRNRSRCMRRLPSGFES